jgi:hypothetical protein
MPTRLDRPMIAPVVVEGSNPTHPFGEPGVGEVPVIPAMAALSNALDCAMGVRMRQARHVAGPCLGGLVGTRGQQEHRSVVVPEG